MTTPQPMAATKPDAPKTVTFWGGRATFDLETKILKVDGDRVRLAPEATSLLFELATGDSGRTHRMRTLMDALDVECENTLRSKASRLRRALRAGCEQSRTLADPVKSEYGVGYRLAP